MYRYTAKQPNQAILILKFNMLHCTNATETAHTRKPLSHSANTVREAFSAYVAPQSPRPAGGSDTQLRPAAGHGNAPPVARSCRGQANC
jgi:hypothetical protein